MKLRPALTFVELLIVTSIIAILAIGSFTSYFNAKERYALKLSSENFVNQLERAHIYAREEKDNKSWGIKIKDDENYVLMSRDKTGETESYKYSLSYPVKFTTGSKIIWFDQGTGNLAGDIEIKLESLKGDTKTIKISQYGIISEL